MLATAQRAAGWPLMPPKLRGWAGGKDTEWGGNTRLYKVPPNCPQVQLEEILGILVIVIRS